MGGSDKGTSERGSDWGLQRRRSSAASAARLANGPPLPTLQWSSKTFAPSEFPGAFNKPQIVRLLSGEHQVAEETIPVPGKRVDLGGGLDTSQPFLVYSHRRRTKVFAEHLAWDKAKKSYQPNGPLLEIPKDYIGWLEVVSKDGKSRGHHSNISSVVGTGCKYFLTRTTLLGFNISDDEENGLQILGEKKIYPGEVVKVDRIISKKWKLIDGTLRGLVKPETTFLKCTDLKKNELCVSMAHPGIFNAVAQHGLNKDEKVVYLINDITKVFKLPIYVKLAFGWPPKLSGQEFSGILKLNEIDKKETLVAYNFQQGKTMIVEIPTDMNLRLQTIDNMSEAEESVGFKIAMEQCVESVYPYVVSMKAMEIPYETIEGTSIPAKKRPLAYGRMAKPYDMKLFSRSDIFPPLEEQQMSTLSRLSFKDPERSLKGLYHMDIDSILETSTDGSVIHGGGDGGSGTHSRTSSNASSSLGKLGDRMSNMEVKDEQEMPDGNYGGPTGETLDRDMRDSRAVRMKEIMQREAKC